MASPLDLALADLLDEMRQLLPPSSPPPPPKPNVSIASVSERPLGVGNWRGNERRSGIGEVALKGGRLDALVRFQLWGDEPTAVDTAINNLHADLLAKKENLRAAGFLRIEAENAASAEPIATATFSAWRKTADYRVLYEFHFEDTDDASSLIAKIPIGIDSNFGESMTITDELVRWDNEAAPTLMVRGRFKVRGVSAFAFIPGAAPSSAVSFTRTFDGATGPPTIIPTLPAFLAAVAGSNAERHARFGFATFDDFLGALSSFKITKRSLAQLKDEGVDPAVLAQLQNIKDKEIVGKEQFLTVLRATIGDPQTATFKSLILKHADTTEPVTMGDWNTDGISDIYEPRTVTFNPMIELPGPSDRLEITYQSAAFDQIAVVYLRALRR